MKLLAIGLSAGALLAAGCLRFGVDEQTSSPTSSQLARCRAVMHLKSDRKLSPLGFKLDGSGIDDRICFKFQTDSSDPAEVFDTTIVDVTKFQAGYAFLQDDEGVSWWDVRGQTFVGGQVSLPGGRFMDVGIRPVAEGAVVYICWFAT